MELLAFYLQSGAPLDAAAILFFIKGESYGAGTCRFSPSDHLVHPIDLIRIVYSLDQPFHFWV